MNTFFKSNKYKLNPIITSIQHVPFIPVFTQENISLLSGVEKDIYLMKQKRRNIYRNSVNAWLDEPLFDIHGVVFEFPKDSVDFYNSLLEQYKIQYMIIHNQLNNLSKITIDLNYFDNKDNINKYEKSYNLEFILKHEDNDNEDNDNEDNDNEDNEDNKIIVSDTELINTINSTDMKEYTVVVRDVLQTIYKEILELIIFNNYDIIDITLFKEDFIHFMYILSDINTEKLLKNAL